MPLPTTAILTRAGDQKLFTVQTLDDGQMTVVSSDGETDVVRLKGRGSIFEEHRSVATGVSYFVRLNGKPVSDALAKAVSHPRHHPHGF